MWHPRLLQTIVHYMQVQIYKYIEIIYQYVYYIYVHFSMQGSLSCLLGDIPHAENELKGSIL